ncbi:PREDICTED: uncharacterized protein LOC105571160 [Vollenhovia emeryi]|uniref:uncharacterized protein LOC105571160 n=1 Tax=Vollenhovia emeryi TaxID=411798 RepID=UPI0005F4A3E6|nr:PREDICTED: uncharacterized protein LOC105571160 [Vollenhovia emeryi]
MQTETVTWPHLQDLLLADKDFTSPEHIDLILGADVYAQILEDGVVKGDADAPIAQRTSLGWIILGPSGLASLSLKIFTGSMSRSIINFMNCFSGSGTSRKSPRQSRRLSLPKNQNANNILSQHILGISKGGILKLEDDSDYSKLYSDFMFDYEQLQHMTRVPESQPEPSLTYYLPHHGVIRESSSTTRLRVVFNGSSRTSSGHSLNDLLHTGAKLQVDLLNVLLWFRLFRYVFSSDMEKMFRQINVHDSDWDFQRILWFAKTNRITTFQLTTVTYGLACAPFLALRVLEQLIMDEGANYPLAVPILQKGRYVDDLFGGGDSISAVQELAKQTHQLCMAGGFPLQKWVSNHPDVLRAIAPEKQAHSTSCQINDTPITNILGLCWNASTDTFHFTLASTSTAEITKRRVLSSIAKLFDPLGLVSPVIIKAKIIMQELWSIKIGWDEPLPSHAAVKWREFVEELQDMPCLSFPRWIGIADNHAVEVHGFCDASKLTICAAVYIRVFSSNGDITSHLVVSKTEVAPLKRLTIPRLELSGAVLLAKLVNRVLAVWTLNTQAIYLWTDSAITYTWINNHPSRWKDYVHNRVRFIQETLPHAIWKFVPGTDNPADCGTRGLSPNQLANHSIWWTGPSWLLQDTSSWPHPPQLWIQETMLEERPTHVAVIAPRKLTEPWDLLQRYSDLNRLTRITAWCRRGVTRFRRALTPPSGPLTTHELKAAMEFWVQTIQRTHFNHELTILKKGEVLPRSSSLVRLTPIVDSKGLLRVGGRLNSSLLSPEAKHPLILPRRSALTSLIISDAHIRTMHGGTQVTLTFLRNNYWIVGGRAPVRSHILNCVKCARYRQQRAQQLMGQLPIERATPSRPFLHSGIDYAGPLIIKTWKGKNAKSYKAYISLFVCQVTSAVHLELVTDYTADGFIAAYKRFTSRRGICATLRSDCGTNLKGADAELNRLFSSATTECGALANLLANDGTQWLFNPPAAPHFGGKWEAGVKSVKFHLKRAIGDHHLTYEEMSTLLSQVEAVLNSRPLSPLSDDPEDINALTPGHFLMGCAPATIPEPSLEFERQSHLSRWQLNRQMLESFWKRWSSECLQRYLAVYKWNRANPSIQKALSCWSSMNVTLHPSGHWDES